MPIINTDNHFIPGLELARTFFHELVKPILHQHFPMLRYSAGLIGSGSEVLGFDTELSSDHHWGPRVMLFFENEDLETYSTDIKATFARELPFTFRGYSTNWSIPNPNDNGVQHLVPTDTHPINHRVDLLSIEGFCTSYLNVTAKGDLLSSEWLHIPFQKLRTMVAGEVFHDKLGLQALRDRFSWYPHDVWLYILGCGWARIGQEEHLMGRAGSVSDEIGSALLGSRLVRDIMRLAFLMERQYPPYPKWFGTSMSP